MEQPSEPRTWSVFGVDKGPDAPTRFMHLFDNIRGTQFARPDLPAIEITLIEDPDGDYAGFIRTGGTRMSMIEHHKIFPVQFPYGIDASLAAGEGEVVRLRAEIAPSAASPTV